MAKYDLSKLIDRDRDDKRTEALKKKGALVELKSLEKRSLSQNAYLHLILSWFALEFGYSKRFVKLEIFKKLVNPDIFIVDKMNKKQQYYEDVISTADISKDNKTLAIDRFRDYSSKAGFYLPEPSDLVYLREIEIELEKAKQYL